MGAVVLVAAGAACVFAPEPAPGGRAPFTESMLAPCVSDRLGLVVDVDPAPGENQPVRTMQCVARDSAPVGGEPASQFRWVVVAVDHEPVELLFGSAPMDKGALR